MIIITKLKKIYFQEEEAEMIVETFLSFKELQKDYQQNRIQIVNNNLKNKIINKNNKN